MLGTATMATRVQLNSREASQDNLKLTGEENGAREVVEAAGVGELRRRWGLTGAGEDEWVKSQIEGAVSFTGWRGRSGYEESAGGPSNLRR